MANVELTKIEERLGGQLLFNVRLNATAGRIEFPISISNQGSAASNEMTVLQSAFALANELGASIRLSLEGEGSETRSG
jgi:hypothetical protein